AGASRDPVADPPQAEPDESNGERDEDRGLDPLERPVATSRLVGGLDMQTELPDARLDGILVGQALSRKRQPRTAGTEHVEVEHLAVAKEMPRAVERLRREHPVTEPRARVGTAEWVAHRAPAGEMRSEPELDAEANGRIEAERRRHGRNRSADECPGCHARRQREERVRDGDD